MDPTKINQLGEQSSGLGARVRVSCCLMGAGAPRKEFSRLSSVFFHLSRSQCLRTQRASGRSTTRLSKRLGMDLGCSGRAIESKESAGAVRPASALRFSFQPLRQLDYKTRNALKAISSQSVKGKTFTKVGSPSGKLQDIEPRGISQHASA